MMTPPPSSLSVSTCLLEMASFSELHALMVTILPCHSLLSGIPLLLISSPSLQRAVCLLSTSLVHREPWVVGLGWKETHHGSCSCTLQRGQLSQKLSFTRWMKELVTLKILINNVSGQPREKLACRCWGANWEMKQWFLPSQARVFVPQPGRKGERGFPCSLWV